MPEGVKPSKADIRHDLRDIAAFIVLDDVEVGRGGLEEILDALPSATFLVAGTRRSLWGGGRSVALGGLPGGAAVELLERELGRELERLDELEEAVTAEEPDLATMAYVKHWFLTKLPSVAGVVTSILVNPIVGKLVQSAGAAAIAEWGPPGS